MRPKRRHSDGYRSIIIFMAKSNTITYKELFKIFLKAGCAFGGGLGILSILEQEFIVKRKLVDRKEFLSMYGIGRVVPSGTVSALAVGFGYKYKKTIGACIALLGLILPGFTVTVIAAAFYTLLKGTHIIELLNISILPAAVGLIVLAALNLGKEVYHSKLLILFACIAFIASFFLKISPAIILICGGLLSSILFRYVKEFDVTP